MSWLSQRTAAERVVLALLGALLLRWALYGGVS